MEFTFRNELNKALTDLHYLPFLSVQEKVIPLFLKGRNLLVQANTGAGKTASYLIPIIEMSEEFSPVTSLIIAPTRELALQIKEECDRLSAYTRVHSALLIGGLSEEIQIRDLKAHPQIIIGTPGRIHYMCRENLLDLSSLKTLVIDEADMIYATGQKEELLSILSYIRHPVQTVCLSATITDSVKEYLPEQYETVFIDESAINQNITAYHLVCEVKFRSLLKVLRHLPVSSAIVFFNHRSDAERTAEKLQKQNILAEAFSGSFDEGTRIQRIRDFQNGTIRVLCATDAAARGLDIHDLSHIIHFDMPTDSETFIHRSGRSAHQQNEGTAIVLLNEKDRLTSDGAYYQSTLPALQLNLDASNDLTKPLTKETIHSVAVKQIRINAGKDDKIRPKDIVGALCTYMPFESIGKIEIRQHDSLVTLTDPSFDTSVLAEISVKGKLRTVRTLK